MVYKIGYFIVGSNLVDVETANKIRLNHDGDYVKLYNNTPYRKATEKNIPMNLFIRRDKHVRKYKKQFLQDDKKVYDEHEIEDYTVKPGENIEFVNEEHGWKGDVRRDIDLTITLEGVGGLGEEIEDPVDIDPNQAMDQFWRDYGTYLIWSLVIIGIIITIVIIVWKFDIFGKGKIGPKKLKAKGVIQSA